MMAYAEQRECRHARIADYFGEQGVAIGAVFLTTAALETVLNPLLGRFTDRRGYLLPVGGGGLSSGFAFVATQRLPDAAVVGCTRRAR